MNKDIIRMANEAAIGHPEVDPEDIPPLEGEDLALFERFADLIRADEREVIADLLEHGYTDDEGHHIQYAEEIRARGNT